MSAPTATGRVGSSGPVEFIPTLREDAEQPATMDLSMRLEISLEDAAATLWLVLCKGGVELSAFDDEWFVHEMVLEKLFAAGGDAVATVREEMNKQNPGTFEAHTAHALRSIVARLYGTATTREPSVGTRTASAPTKGDSSSELP